ncbi:MULTISPECIES: peptidoglycan editing factor PgeF [unclassified Sulfurospirillum]|uniref:peptidoglycan editing factor PgeF n=1 Tax=unclassified Sulfurospirillum TaxID=2618290 RepID=UPI00068EA3E4|nr:MULTISPECIES: peptidoglycan editing factor PgeF [unclassified Sulfurospirillum]
MQHFFTNRFEGVSEAPFASLNLGLHVNDTALHVNQNRARVKAKLGVPKLVFMDQVHGDRVVQIHSGDELPVCDAMITNVSNIALAVMVADCIPILYYDEVHQAIGVAHAGRAGTLLQVGQKCARAMTEHFGTRLQELKIWMGPSIRSCCYEVGYEATQGLESFLHVKNGNYFLDLQNANLEAFLAMGIPREHISLSEVCTCCDHAYFSYRRDKITGRFAGVIAL